MCVFIKRKDGGLNNLNSLECNMNYLNISVSSESPFLTYNTSVLFYCSFHCSSDLGFLVVLTCYGSNTMPHGIFSAFAAILLASFSL